MAKKVEWSEAALKDRLNIYLYWHARNNSDSYSRKLEILFTEAAKLISAFPKIGQPTNSGVRVKIVSHFRIYYSYSAEAIQIIRIWDTRQDPEALNF